MFYVYVLESVKDRELYIGYTDDLKSRFKLHTEGKVKSTKHRRSLKLIYYEAYLEKADAKGRELFLKSGSGHKFIRKQLAHYFRKLQEEKISD